MEPSTLKKRTSYSADAKIKICRRADEIGGRGAANEFHVSECNIRRWKKSVPELQEMKNKKKKARRHGTPKWPELELELRQWILDKRAVKAQGLMDGLTDFYGAAASLSERELQLGYPLPDDWIEKVELFRAYVADKKSFGTITPQHIVNMDEVPCSFDMPGNKTIAQKGHEDIAIDTTGSEKKNFTIVLAVSAYGVKLTPMVIFKRKTIPKEVFPSNILVRANPKGWMNAELMKDWIENVWEKRSSAFFKKPKKTESLLIYDSCTAHLTPEVKAIVEKKTTLAVIPAGMTKYLQPLDILVKKSFKASIRKSWDEWMLDDAMVSLTRGGKRRKASFATVCTWISVAWQSVKVSTIKNGFKKAGIQDYDDDDDETANFDGFEVHMESEGSATTSDDDEQLPPIENLHLDSDEDNEFMGDEFDGFDPSDIEDFV